jgi:hypothetical protein
MTLVAMMKLMIFISLPHLGKQAGQLPTLF